MSMKKLTSLALVLVMVMALLAGCACNHEWEGATTDAPKTCKLCGETEGEKINVDERFQTSACKDVFGEWEAEYEMDGAMIGVPGLKLDYKMFMSLSNDGQMEMTAEFKDPAAAEKSLADYLEKTMLDTYTGMGLSKEQAEAATQQAYGMSIKEYAEKSAKEALTNISVTQKMVYYVEDGKIYAAKSWDDEFDGEEFTMENGKLLLEDSDLGQTLEFTKK